MVVFSDSVLLGLIPRGIVLWPTSGIIVAFVREMSISNRLDVGGRTQRATLPADEDPVG